MSAVATKEELQSLYDDGKNFAQIGEIIGVSREWVRVLANEYGIEPKCAVCGVPLASYRTRICGDCKATRRRDARRVAAVNNKKPNTYAHRPMVGVAAQFYWDAGVDVVVGRFCRQGEPELSVGDVKIKVFALSPLSKGHQVRLRHVSGVDYYHLCCSDGTLYIIPAGALSKPVGYIGERSMLRQYGEIDSVGRILAELGQP